MSQSYRAAAVFSAGLEHPSLDPFGRTSGAAMWPAGPFAQASLALSVEPIDPLVCALARDAQLLGHMRHGSTQDTNTMNEQAAAIRIEAGITVGHEDLLVQ
jgi:hypothetical protein